MGFPFLFLIIFFSGLAGFFLTGYLGVVYIGICTTINTVLLILLVRKVYGKSNNGNDI
ncbi:putative membrane protein [Anoxybacillus amylolyticus]|uniref:Putative membrane protein n=1 Tax=Anoxybacteroides amylolyticum TaxID=294699 RepID=A0A160F1Q6_9BACL|nr:putative membrane protein [Anoxybacillus amylolyticus]